MNSIYVKEEREKKNISYSLSILRVIAMLMIINSHSDVLFPNNLSFLASGGAIGNELFFLISGYLFSSNGNFIQFCIKRFIRLFIPVYIVTIILFVLNFYSFQHLKSISGLIYYFVWPTDFWFVSSCFLFCMFLYFILRSKIWKNKYTFLCFLLFIIIVNIFIYVFFIPNKSIWIIEDFRLFGNFPYKSIYSFIVFLFGYYIKDNDGYLRMRFNQKKMLLVSFSSFISFYCFKLLIHKNILSMDFQIVSQPLTVIFVLSFFILCLYSDKLEQLISNLKIKRMIYAISCITLESYLIQFSVIDRVSKLNFYFPLNYFVSLIVIILSSFVFYKINSGINNMINNLIFNKSKFQK